VNSQNQRWSRWDYRAYPATRATDAATLTAAAARFGRVLFGSASVMRVRGSLEDGQWCWAVSVLTEGGPVHDPRYANWVHRQWVEFFQHGFGPTCQVRAQARLVAGSRQDGTPAEQGIILPPLAVIGRI